MPRLRFALLNLLFSLAMSSAALAQDVKPMEKDDGGWIVYVIAIVLAIGVVTASVMSSRRTHQD
jgi:hypothetical protein